MPAKFKPSERVFNRNSFGRRTASESGPNQKWTHYWLKGTSKEELFKAINSDRTKPKHRQKFVNELVRRGVKIVWRSPND